MIELRNIKMFTDNKALKQGKCERKHIKDSITSVMFNEWKDDDDQYLVRVNFKGLNYVAGLFDTKEKAEKFYDAIKALLPDSDAQNAVIDHKDFE